MKNTEKLNVGNEVKIKKDFVVITEKLDLERLANEDGEVSMVGVPCREVNLDNTYTVKDIDIDGDVGVMLLDGDEVPAYFYADALTKITNKKD